jgi:hypothetical protein
MADSIVNYRAFRNDWRTNLFVANPDSVFFESVPVGDSATTNVTLRNNSSDPVEIKGYYLKNSHYAVEQPIPFIIPASGSVPLTIKFKLGADGYFKDTLHIRSDSENKRVAQIMILAGRTDSIYSGIQYDILVDDYKLKQNYPNSFNPVTNIKFSIPQRSFVNVKIFDLFGIEIEQLVNDEMDAGTHFVEFNASSLPSGIYPYRLNAGNFIQTKKMILLK